MKRPKYFECLYCEDMFRILEEYLDHLKNAHNKPKLVCHICPKFSLFTQQELEEHNISEHGFIFCQKCNKNYEPTKLHWCDSEIDVFVCDLASCANKQINSVDDFVEHLRNSHSLQGADAIAYMIRAKTKRILKRVVEFPRGWLVAEASS